ncbi:MAG: PDZ domain-containing protein, partial [Gemmatimonadota bacterium]
MRLRLWCLALVAVSSLAGGCAEKPAAAAGAVAGTSLFDQVFRHIRSYAVDSLDDNRIYGFAASGLLEELGDPYAALVSSRDRRPESADAPVERLGIYLDRAAGQLTVVATIPGSPAAGHLENGDVIFRIDKTPAVALSPEAAAPLLEGADGSAVLLRVRHVSDQRP